MKRYCGKFLTGCLAACIAFSGFSINVNASEKVSTVLPSGGVSLTLVNNTPLESIQTETVENRNIEANVSILDIPEPMNQVVIDPEEELFRNLVIAQVHDYVNVRELPSEDGTVVGKLYDDSVGNLIGEENGWYKITSGAVTGYVKAEYCVTGDSAIELAKQVGTRLATVTGETLFVRHDPTIESSVIAMVPKGDELLVFDETDGWAKINVEEGDGWVSKDYVDIHTEFVQAESKAEEEARLKKEAEERKKAQQAAEAKRASNKTNQTTQSTTQSSQNYSVGEGSELGVAVAQYALQFVGNPYVWGGTSLTKGADCSGFVMSVYANFGVTLPHSSAADRKQGYAVDSLDNAQPGDLICYSGHVAMYIGNGQIVHASTKKTGIIVSNASYKKILAIRRIF